MCSVHLSSLSQITPKYLQLVTTLSKQTRTMLFVIKFRSRTNNDKRLNPLRVVLHAMPVRAVPRIGINRSD
jgi:hypothetical protein